MFDCMVYNLLNCNFFMYTLVDLNPPPIRFCSTTGGETGKWIKSGSYIVRDNPSQLSWGRLTPDDWEEGAEKYLDRLFLEPPDIFTRTPQSPVGDYKINKKKKKPYTSKPKQPVFIGGNSGRGFGPKTT